MANGIQKASSFEELFKILEAKKVIGSTGKQHKAGEIINRIRLTRREFIEKFKEIMSGITREEGLRNKVAELAINEAAEKIQAEKKM